MDSPFACARLDQFASICDDIRRMHLRILTKSSTGMRIFSVWSDSMPFTMIDEELVNRE
jgi:hypothetical protein